MNARDKRRLRQIREQILRQWPEVANAPDVHEVLQHLPVDDPLEGVVFEDPLAGVEFEDPLESVTFPEDTPQPDYRGMSDHAKRVFRAIGDFHGKPFDQFPRAV